MTSRTTAGRRRLFVSPAAYALAQAGATQTELAGALGVTQTAASLYLRGLRRAPEPLPAVMAELIGEEAAADVLAAIPDYKPASASVADA